MSAIEQCDRKAYMSMSVVEGDLLMCARAFQIQMVDSYSTKTNNTNTNMLSRAHCVRVQALTTFFPTSTPSPGQQLHPFRLLTLRILVRQDLLVDEHGLHVEEGMVEGVRIARMHAGGFALSADTETWVDIILYIALVRCVSARRAKHIRATHWHKPRTVAQSEDCRHGWKVPAICSRSPGATHRCIWRVIEVVSVGLFKNWMPFHRLLSSPRSINRSRTLF